ncbi:glycerate kinase [Virgibacillus natechei]|uniref:glycerate kinase n=1 Tax=Virgibacillus sp. CBA3643 TaxID=2942278 RepID=UPI0035A342CE
MNIVLAPDSYKGSLTSIEAADAMKRAIQSLALDDTITSKPIADGGEGQSDEQTLYGKSPGYIANLANANHVPAILISGSLTG